MTEITNPTLVTDVEKDPTAEEQERMVVREFIIACSKGNLETVINQLKNKGIRNIIVSKKNNFYITEALNIICKNNQGKFVEDFIFNREIMELLGNINRPTIFKHACENGHMELVKLLINRRLILDELNVEDIEYIFSISAFNGYEDIISELLKNKTIRGKIINSDANNIVSQTIYGAYVLNNKLSIDKKKDIASIILDDLEFVNEIYEDTLNGILKMICNYGHYELFEKIMKSKLLKQKINADGIAEAFRSSYNSNHNNLFTEILKDNELKKMIIDKHPDYIENCFVDACKNNKQEIVDILKTNEEIKDKILPNSFEKACKNGNVRAIEELISIDGMLDKIKSSGSNVIQGCFQIAYTNAKIDVINTLINNEKTRSEISNVVVQDRFEEACISKNLDMIKLFLENKNLKNAIDINNQDLKNIFTNILTKEEQLDEKEIELSILFLNNNIEPGNGIDNNNYEKVKNKIGKLIEGFVEDKNKLKTIQKNIENIKTGKGYKEFIKKNKKLSYAENWKDNSPLQKTILSLEKIKDELGISQGISITK